MFQIYTALITPFDKCGGVDYKALSKVIDRLIEQGNQHFVLCGTTSEAPTLRFDEKKQIIRFVRYHYPQTTLYVGVSTNATNDAIMQIQAFDQIEGIEGYMVVTPYYNKPSQKGMIEHFTMISKQTKRNIMLYNVPSRCNVNLENESIIELALNCPNIIALKQAGSLEGVEGIKERCPNFKIYVGNDDQLLMAIQKKIDGIISVVSHFQYLRMKNIIETKDVQENEIIQKISETIFSEPSPTPIKYILSKIDHIENKMRLPLVPVSKKLEKKLDDLILKYR